MKFNENCSVSVECFVCVCVCVFVCVRARRGALEFCVHLCAIITLCEGSRPLRLHACERSLGAQLRSCDSGDGGGDGGGETKANE
jgi:hypothetical protein